MAIFQKESCTLNLAVLHCESGSANAIYGELKKVLDQFDAWKNIAMIICDTTAVNTGCLNGVVKQLEDDVVSAGFAKPQYIGCQHHVLDLIVKHVLDYATKEPDTSKPKLSYFFIATLDNEYLSLQTEYEENSRTSFSCNHRRKPRMARRLPIPV